MREQARACDVVVVGAGLAGLTAAYRLRRAGTDVRILEAHSVAGGRVQGSSGGLDTGAEFVGRPHSAVRCLIADLGLHTTPSGLGRSPVLWRLPGSNRSSVRPPIPLTEVWRLGVALRRLRANALRLDANAPWDSAGIADLDYSSLADWLSGQGVTRSGLDLADALIGGFATRSIAEMSAAHAAWWIASADGLVAALRSGQQFVVSGGAHQIPHRLAQRLADRIDCSNPVAAVRVRAGGVNVIARKNNWHARVVVVAVPLPSLHQIEFEPALPWKLQAAAAELSYGTAIKVTATTTVRSPVRHRSVVGDRPLAVAWRRGRALSGIATSHATPEEVTADLAGAFEIPAAALRDVAVTDWTHRDHIGGSYLVFRPGEIGTFASVLRQPISDRIQFAGCDFSKWPNSMEGAVRSGRAAADAFVGPFR